MSVNLAVILALVTLGVFCISIGLLLTLRPRE